MIFRHIILFSFRSPPPPSSSHFWSHVSQDPEHRKSEPQSAGGSRLVWPSSCCCPAVCPAACPGGCPGGSPAALEGRHLECTTSLLFFPPLPLSAKNAIFLERGEETERNGFRSECSDHPGSLAPQCRRKRSSRSSAHPGKHQGHSGTTSDGSSQPLPAWSRWNSRAEEEQAS